MKELNLPKKYLSYSAISLWRKSKDQYREKYYENGPSFETVETIFGNHIGRLMENPEEVAKHPVLSTIPNYPVKEHPIIVEIGGVKIMGYLDQFHDEKLAFIEMKTGHPNKDGKAPWDRVKVMKHDQLPFYSLLIEKKYGKVEPYCQLVWLETAFQKKSKEFAGHVLEAEGRELVLTGKVEVFKRRIAKWERERIEKMIVDTAAEISADYTKYLAFKNVK